VQFDELDKFKNTKFLIEVLPDYEAIRLANQIISLLNTANWHLENVKVVDMLELYRPLDDSREWIQESIQEYNVQEGVFIIANGTRKISPPRENTEAAAEALYNQLNANSVLSDIVIDTRIPSNTIRILIGHKPIVPFYTMRIDRLKDKYKGLTIIELEKKIESFVLEVDSYWKICTSEEDSIQQKNSNRITEINNKYAKENIDWSDINNPRNKEIDKCWNENLLEEMRFKNVVGEKYYNRFYNESLILRDEVLLRFPNLDNKITKELGSIIKWRAFESKFSPADIGYVIFYFEWVLKQI
jgi:hypothetical protein